MLRSQRIKFTILHHRLVCHSVKRWGNKQTARRKYALEQRERKGWGWMRDGDKIKWLG